MKTGSSFTGIFVQGKLIISNQIMRIKIKAKKERKDLQVATIGMDDPGVWLSSWAVIHGISVGLGDAALSARWK